MRTVRRKAREIEHRVICLDFEMVKWVIDKRFLIVETTNKDGEKTDR
jgi:hypothetical protein